jgi:phosphonate transport system substrate-binding protein
MHDTSNPRPRRFGAQFFVTVFLILVAAGAGAAAMYFLKVHKPLEANVDANSKLQLALTGSTDDGAHLGEGFVDSDGDMIADPPSDPSKLIDPPKLVFCYIAQEDEDKYAEIFKPFCEHLSKVTGKPVEYLPLYSTEDQLKALQEGKIQVSGLNTGSVPVAVNLCGFVPVCRVPTNDPAGTHIEIIVPSSVTDINKPEDLKNHELTLTQPTSNSGYKAPMVLLKSQFSLAPEKDYVVRMSQEHDKSIEGIAKGEYQAAAVASDMLERAEANGVITKDKYRSIYKSESFPSAAIGYVYNLKPELAAKVREALLTYDFKGTPLETEFVAKDQTKFVPVNYKNDWALIRRIDEESARLRANR